MTPDEASDALSEKEREALRLLLAGNDAKSTGRLLGVSHHAIHDRLRSARLKLGTTSSRQAALLLRGSENATPDQLVHKPIGGATFPDFPEGPDSASMKRPGSSWRHRRNAGLIIMSVSILIVAATIAFISDGATPSQYAGAAEAQPLVSAGVVSSPAKTTSRDGPTETIAANQARSGMAAGEFLALFDQGKAAESYAAAAPALRNTHGIALWELAAAVRATEGGAQRRTLIDVQTDASPTNPAFEALEILTFDTMMLNGKHMVERLVMARIDGGWYAAAFDAEEVDKR